MWATHKILEHIIIITQSGNFAVILCPKSCTKHPDFYTYPVPLSRKRSIRILLFCQLYTKGRFICALWNALPHICKQLLSKLIPCYIYPCFLAIIRSRHMIALFMRSGFDLRLLPTEFVSPHFIYRMLPLPQKIMGTVYTVDAAMGRTEGGIMIWHLLCFICLIS